MLGAVLNSAAGEQVYPAAIAATQFLGLAGWRSGEAPGLRMRLILIGALRFLLTPKLVAACACSQAPHVMYCGTSCDQVTLCFRRHEVMAA